MYKISTTQGDKLPVVLASYAIVKPKTMMIESFDALIAHATVLRRCVHIFFTNLAKHNHLNRLLFQNRGACVFYLTL